MFLTVWFKEHSDETLRHIANDLAKHGFVEVKPALPDLIRYTESYPLNPYYFGPRKIKERRNHVEARITYLGKKHLKEIFQELERTPSSAKEQVSEIESPLKELIEVMAKMKNEDNSVNIYGQVGNLDNSKGKNLTEHHHAAAPAPEPKKSNTHWLQIVYWVVGILGVAFTIWGAFYLTSK